MSFSGNAELSSLSKDLMMPKAVLMDATGVEDLVIPPDLSSQLTSTTGAVASCPALHGSRHQVITTPVIIFATGSMGAFLLSESSALGW